MATASASPSPTPLSASNRPRSHRRPLHPVEWSTTGDHFEVKCPDKVSRDVLPKFFRHNNFSSFQRQLNYFGFRKTGRGKRGCLYFHEDFCLHRPHDVLRIRRKTNTGGAKGHHTNKCGLLPSSQVAAAAAAAPPASMAPVAPAVPVEQVKPAMSAVMFTLATAPSATPPADLGISPLNTSCGDPTVSASARHKMTNQLVVTVPLRHRFGTRRAASLSKRERSVEDLEALSEAVQQKRARTGALGQSSTASSSSPPSSSAGVALEHPESPITALSAETMEQQAVQNRSQRPSLMHASSFEQLSCMFDSDPFLQPLSPLQLSSPWPTGDEPFSPLFTPKSAKSDVQSSGTNAMHKMAMHTAMAQVGPTLSA